MAAPVIASKVLEAVVNSVVTINPPPSGIQDGDLLLIVTSHEGNATAFVPPSGFTEITPNDGDKAPGNLATLWMAYKIASSESGSYVVSWTTTTRVVAFMYRITGAVSGSEIQDPNNVNNGTSDTSTASDFLTDTNDSLALALHAIDEDDVTNSEGGTGWTNEDFLALDPTNAVSIKTIGTAGQTLDSTYPISPDQAWVTRQIAIRSIAPSAGNTKTFLLDAILKAVTTKTFLLDAILNKLKTQKTFRVDAALQDTFTKTFRVDAALQDTFTKTFTIDARIAVFVKTFLIDARLKGTLTKTFLLDSILKIVQTKTFLIDASLETLALTKTFLIDSHLKATPLKTFLLDGVLIDTLTKTYSLDAIIELVQTKIFALDAILQKNFTKTFLLDGALSNTFNKTFSANAILSQQTIKSFLLDALLLGTPQKTFSIDAIIEANPNVLPEITDIDLISIETRSTPLIPIAPTSINLISQKTTSIPVEDGS